MTPLAHRITKELTLPIKNREGLWGDMPTRMDDIHCFEVTDVIECARDLERQMYAVGFNGDWAFLPAEKTWIEWRKELDGISWREGLLLTRSGDDVMHVERVMDSGSKDIFVLPLRGISGGRDMLGAVLDRAYATTTPIFGILAIINTPRIMGRKQHMPHRGLERKLANAKGLVGKFPLHAWTELTLSASAMMKQADGTVHEAHYTGEKCLHFCRAHLRVQNGKLVQVSAHWRGNPALGMKRTRYKLAA